MMEKLVASSAGMKEMSLDGLEAMAKSIKSRLKDLEYREKTTSRLLARMHALYLSGSIDGKEIFLFLTFLYLASGMPMRSMQDLFAQKTKVKF